MCGRDDPSRRRCALPELPAAAAEAWGCSCSSCQFLSALLGAATSRPLPLLRPHPPASRAAPPRRAKALRAERTAGHDEKRRRMMADLERREKGWETARTQVRCASTWQACWLHQGGLCMAAPRARLVGAAGRLAAARLHGLFANALVLSCAACCCLLIMRAGGVGTCQAANRDGAAPQAGRRASSQKGGRAAGRRSSRAVGVRSGAGGRGASGGGTGGGGRSSRPAGCAERRDEGAPGPHPEGLLVPQGGPAGCCERGSAAPGLHAPAATVAVACRAPRGFEQACARPAARAGRRERPQPGATRPLPLPLYLTSLPPTDPALPTYPQNLHPPAPHRRMGSMARRSCAPSLRCMAQWRTLCCGRARNARDPPWW